METLITKQMPAFPIASHRSGSKFSLSRHRAPIATSEPSSDDVLKDMNPSDIASAVDELKSRLSPATLEFLKKRGQIKINSSATELKSEVDIPAASIAKRMVARVPDDFEEDSGVLVADPRLAARLRFSLHAQVVSIQPDGEKSTQEQVLLRDALRTDMRLVPEGYTITEILILARSSLPNHRALAMRMLSDVLTMARPSSVPLSSLTIKLMSEPVSIPASLNPQRTVFWHEVWQYAVHDLPVTPHIRLALDDDHAQVITAATQALAALLCPSAKDSMEIEAAECCSSTTGWPMCARECYLQRPDAAGVWEEQSAHTPPGPREVAPDEDAPQSPEDVSAIDPCLGLIQMQVLQRIRYLLEVSKPPGSFEPLLASLAALARSSEAVSLLVVKCPRMLEVLKCFLAVDSGNEIFTATQVPALFLIRTLCQMSYLAAQLIRSAGIFPLIQAHLLLACKMLHPSSGIKEDSGGKAQFQLCLIETMRLWKACAHHGAAAGLPSLEDVYSSVCYLFVPPISLNATSMDWNVCREAHLLLTSLLNHALAIDAGDKTLGHSMLSPGITAAIAKDVAYEWLDHGDQQGIIGLVSRLTASSQEQNGNNEMRRPTSWALHPSTTIPISFASSTCLSSALSFLSIYWSSIPYDEIVFREISLMIGKSGLIGDHSTLLPLVERCIDRVFEAIENKLDEVSAASLLFSLLSLWTHVFSDSLDPGSNMPNFPRLILYSSSQGLMKRVNHPPDSLFNKPGKQILSPWHLITLQRTQHFVRLFLFAAKVSRHFNYEQGQGGELSSLEMSYLVTRACFSIPNVTPPGWEPEAFSALSCALTPSSLWKESHAPASHLLIHTFKDLEEDLTMSWPNLAKVTLSSSKRHLTDKCPPLSCYHCPQVKNLVDADKLGNTLLQSYAASWLSLLQVGDNEVYSQTKRRHCPIQYSLSDSRLPTPPMWHLMEAHELPASQVNPVGCALAFSLAMDVTLLKLKESNISFAQGCFQMDPVTKIRWAIHMACLFERSNFLPRKSDEGSWRDPLVRWSLFAMLALPLHEKSRGFEWCTPRMAERITQLYASSTFGDPWFGSFLILPLLKKACPKAIRSHVLKTLQESSTLGLLPPLDFTLSSSP